MTSDWEVCGDCAQPYTVVYRLPDALWARIMKTHTGSGLLCPDCVNARARELGISLYWAAMEGEYPDTLGAPPPSADGFEPDSLF